MGKTHRRPPWSSMIDLEIERPTPIPFDFVVKNASKMWLMFFGSIPVPLSAIDIITSFGG